MGDLGVLAAFVIARLCGHLWSRCLRQDIVQCLGIKRILIVRSDHLRRAVLKPFKVGLFFWPVSLGPPFGKSQKMGDLGVLAAFVIARLCGHLWSRCLRQDVVRCLGFKRIQIVRSDHLRRAVFKPLKSACFLGQFPWSPLWKISENGRFGCPCGICHSSALRALMESLFATRCCPMSGL